MDLVRKWMSGAVMTNNSMEDVASKFGNNWGRLAAVIVTLAQPCEIPQGVGLQSGVVTWYSLPTQLAAQTPCKTAFLCSVFLSFLNARRKNTD